jgi:hypothetical protein
MRRFGFLLSLALLTITSMAFAPRPLLKGDPWLGTWKVKLTPSGDDANKPGVKEIDEELTFTQDEMSTKTLAAKGFKPAKFDEDTTVMGPATMKCTQTSNTDGKLEWMGTATGQDMTGNVVWTKKDETQIHYDIQGAKKP